MVKITVTPSSWLEPEADIAAQGPARVAAYLDGALVLTADLRTVQKACDYCNRKSWRFVAKSTGDHVEILAPGFSQTLNIDPQSWTNNNVRI